MDYSEVLKKLESRGYTLSAMESITGGAFSSAVVSIPGASKVFKGGVVAYSTDAKTCFGVKEETIKEHGTISLACAKEMALSVAKKFETDISIAFTGNAGPEPQEDKPIGLVYIAIRFIDKLLTFEVGLKGERDKIIKECVDLGFKILNDKLN